MNLPIVIVTLCAAVLSSAQAQVYNPIPNYQQGSQFYLPGQATNNYQPGVPLPSNVQQLGAQSVMQQPGQVPFNNYQPGVPNYQSGVPNYEPGVPVNIQQLTQSGSTSPIQPTNVQGVPFGNQQGFQQNGGIPINTLQQPNFPVNQQYNPQIGNVGGPGPITFPR